MAKKILIVDDEKITTDFLAGLLRQQGLVVYKAFDSKEALENIQSHLPNLVLLDMKLLGIGGLEVLKILRRDNPDIRTIVMTGYDADYRQKVLKTGCDAFFSKPILIEDLKKKIEELMISDNSQKEPASEGIGSALPQAKILIFEARKATGRLLLEFFSKIDYCKGNYQVAAGSTKAVEAAIGPGPELVLFDIQLVGLFSEFSYNLLRFGSSLKEVIIFGEPVAEWNELEAVLTGGVISNEAVLCQGSQSQHRQILDRLNNKVISACIKHKLYAKNT